MAAWLVVGFVLAFLSMNGRPGGAWAGPPEKPNDADIDFTEFSLEELKSVKITSASKMPENLSEVPSAVFVITRDDIRRSGATSIPEALRMAPGVEVARISATEWAVNMRDLNQLFANKLLVLMDGRSIYSHVASGVFWDIQDTVLEDIDRIEVIRGPGAALWGVNAVNGVINIITKKAADTRGPQVTALVGTEEGVGTARYGDAMGDEGHYRIYAKYFNRGGLFQEDTDFLGDSAKKDWQSGRGGAKLEWTPGAGRDTLFLEGEIFQNRYEDEIPVAVQEPPFVRETQDISRAKGGHVLGRWTRAFSEKSDSALQFYYDYYDKDIDFANVDVSTYDLDFQHRFSFLDRNEFIWGLNYRLITDRFQNSDDFVLDPDAQTLHYYSAFVQDKIRIVDRLNLTLGAKFEHNDYTGWEIQPSVRLLWTPKDRHSFWSAVSRAARVPSRVEYDGRIEEILFSGAAAEADKGAVLVGMGNDELEAETVIAYEIGYRFQPTTALWFDTTGFYNDYKDLIAFRYNEDARIETDPIPRLIVPLHYDNTLGGESYGVEMAAYWQATPSWLLQGSYTFLKTNLSQDLLDAGGVEAFLVSASNPRNQVSLRSALNLTRRLELDLWFRYVDRLSENDVDDYASLDARLAYRPAERWELSVVGQNLLEARHAEFSSIEVERSVYVKADWCF
ncbi:TonB-dependent receptor plug domain-containing protein [Desulfococcus sp.]|uniref:TonB-dependent receptor plug domain-containing protein n=1 Tax=Desulfococcus sp. TaxID=2025834 RepID=UPI003593A2CF